METLIRPSDEQVERNFKLLRLGAETYDPGDLQAEHLRDHQRRAIAGVREQILETEINEFAEGSGIIIIQPTGSGKTVVLAEMLRIAHNGLRAMAIEHSPTLGAHFMVPLNNSKQQTIGITEESGIRRFAPDLTTAIYDSARKPGSADVTLLSYQSLKFAIAGGYFDGINMPLLVLDECHHVAAEEWGTHVQQLRIGRWAIGATATPAFSESRDARSVLPRTAIEETITDGIRQGYLAPVEGFLYDGVTTLQAPKPDTVNSTSRVHELIMSDDTYRAAAIILKEVARGGKVVVACSPGLDRAHSRRMVNILNQLVVQTSEGERHIRAKHVDSDTKNLQRYTDQLANGKLDVLSSVGVLGESWNCPEADVTVIVRCMFSALANEQLIGRVMRTKEGKTARIHEFVFPLHLDRRHRAVQTHHQMILLAGSEAQVTNPIIADDEFKNLAPRSKVTTDVDSDMIRRIQEGEFDPTPIDTIQVGNDVEGIPFDWINCRHIALALGMDEASLRVVLKDAGITYKEDVLGERRIQYAPANTWRKIANHLNIYRANENTLTIDDAIQLIKTDLTYRNTADPRITSLLRRRGIHSCPRFMKNGTITQTYQLSEIRRFLDMI